jgi:hypothetical protein
MAFIDRYNPAYCIYSIVSDNKQQYSGDKMIDKLTAREMSHWSIVSKKVNEIIDLLNEGTLEKEKQEDKPMTDDP